MGAIVRFVQGVDQLVDQSAREIADRWNELRVNGDQHVIEATCTRA